MQKLLIVIGAALTLIGLSWPWLSKLGLGRLPGDIVIESEHFSFYFPITTMIAVSIIIGLVLRFIGK